MIMASAVMHTGRSLVTPASGDDSMELFPLERKSLQNVTTRMLLAGATPIVINPPINDGTLNVVWVTYSIHRMPAKAPGRAVRMMKGSAHDWKFRAISK